MKTTVTIEATLVDASQYDPDITLPVVLPDNMKRGETLNLIVPVRKLLPLFKEAGYVVVRGEVIR